MAKLQAVAAWTGADRRMVRTCLMKSKNNKLRQSFAVILACLGTGCVSTSFNQLRPAFYPAAAQVEFFCNSVPNDVGQMTELVKAAYAQGWRLVTLGRTQTTFLGITLSDEPIICVERIRGTAH